MSKTATQFTLPKLPYPYEALEPHVDSKTMKIHHTKHHQGYVDKLNKALESAPESIDWSLERILAHLNDLPESIRDDVRKNGGGHANHSLFWKVMTPDGGGQPAGPLAKAIEQEFGSFESFKKKFKEHATGRFGSGWAWLVIHNGKLELTDTPNQDSPIMDGKVPILGIDVWEHAYYLNYQNERGKWIDSFFNIVNWTEVERRFAEAK